MLTIVVYGFEQLQMVDANQIWDVDQAIEWMKPLAKYNLTWIEEPTSPDDILGHAKIAKVCSCCCQTGSRLPYISVSAEDYI